MIFNKVTVLFACTVVLLGSPVSALARDLSVADFKGLHPYSILPLGTASQGAAAHLGEFAPQGHPMSANGNV